MRRGDRRGGWVLAALALAACAAGCPRRDGAGDRLILISPHGEGLVREFTRGFEEAYRRDTGRSIRLEWMDQGGTSDDLRFVQSEFARSPGGIGIDIFFGGGIDAFEVLAGSGLLTPFKLPAAELDGIAPDILGMPVYDKELRWYGAALSGFGVIYNKQLLAQQGLPMVESWSDLARPEYVDQVSAADPRRSGTAHTMYEIILQSQGWAEGYATLAKMAANVRSWINTSSLIPGEVADGNAIFGLAIDFYAYNLIDMVGDEKIGYVMPQGAVVYNPDPIAILKGAPHREAAEAFVRFVLSETGQRLWMQRKGTPRGPQEFGLNRASVRPALYDQLAGLTQVRVNPFALESTQRYDPGMASRRYALVNDLIGATMIDPHAELQQAWRRWIGAGRQPADALDAIVAPPLSEEEAMLWSDRWSDPAFRNEKIAEWSSAALRRYRGLLRGGN